MRLSARALVPVAVALLAWGSSLGTANAVQDVPMRCGDLFAFTLRVEKQRDWRAEFDADLNRKHWETLGPAATFSGFNTTARAALTEAEGRIEALTGFDMDRDSRMVFQRTRAILVEQIRREPKFAASALEDAVGRLERVSVLSADQYVEAYVTRERAPGSTIPEAELRARAYRAYHASCGRHGLNNNAFFDRGAVVLCPGLFLEAHSYGASRRDALDALSFTVAHELGHVLDSSVYPAAYGDLGQCYRAITDTAQVWIPGLADEISADHWGAVVLSEVLNARSDGPPPPEQVVRIIAYATGNFGIRDEDPGEGEHPPAQFRINQTIARHPVMVQLLGCPAAGERNPTCTLQGRLPTAG